MNGTEDGLTRHDDLRPDTHTLNGAAESHTGRRVGGFCPIDLSPYLWVSETLELSLESLLSLFHCVVVSDTKDHRKLWQEESHMNMMHTAHPPVCWLEVNDLSYKYLKVQCSSFNLDIESFLGYKYLTVTIFN